MRVMSCKHVRLADLSKLYWVIDREGVSRDLIFYGTEIASNLNIVDSIPGTGNGVYQIFLAIFYLFIF